jgi:hypothetical protein
LYLFLLMAANYQLAAIVLVQIAGTYLVLFVSIKLLFPRSNLGFQCWLMLLVVLSSTRTFLYSYMILSEAVFSSLILLASALAIGYAMESNPGLSLRKLNGLFACSLAIAWTKSIGVLFLLIVFLLYGYHYFFISRNKSAWLALLLILPMALSINKATLGIWGFSKQDGIQLLISANRYINYDSPYMAKEKNLIRHSHREILNRFYPRTRLDQMVGGVEDLQTPASLLKATSSNYDDFNNKVRNLVLEGLFSNGNWWRFALDGLTETYKMIVLDVQEGLIIPGMIGDFNRAILLQLPYVAKYNALTQKNTPQWVSKYYAGMTRICILPKYISLLCLVISFGAARLLLNTNSRRKILFPPLVIASICLLYLYLSSLLVFALDRYYAGVEWLFWLLSVYLVVEITEALHRKPAGNMSDPLKSSQ